MVIFVSITTISAMEEGSNNNTENKQTTSFKFALVIVYRYLSPGNTLIKSDLISEQNFENDVAKMAENIKGQWIDSLVKTANGRVKEDTIFAWCGKQDEGLSMVTKMENVTKKVAEKVNEHDKQKQLQHEKDIARAKKVYGYTNFFFGLALGVGTTAAVNFYWNNPDKLYDHAGLAQQVISNGASVAYAGIKHKVSGA